MRYQEKSGCVSAWIYVKSATRADITNILDYIIEGCSQCHRTHRSTSLAQTYLGNYINDFDMAGYLILNTRHQEQLYELRNQLY